MKTEPISFADLLLEAELFMSTENVLEHERIKRCHSFLVAEGILPTRRAIQHGSSHHHFAAAMCLLCDHGSCDMLVHRSTTLLAILGSAGMPAMLDRAVLRDLIVSDRSEYKALGILTPTDRLRAICKPISLEELLASEGPNHAA